MLLFLRQQFQSFSGLTIYNFSKKTRPLPTAQFKNKNKSRAFSDEKAAKISQAEQEEQQKKAQEEIKRRQELELLRKTQPKMKTWSSIYDEYVANTDVYRVKQQKFPIYYPVKTAGRGVKQRTPFIEKKIAYPLNEQFRSKKRLQKKIKIPAWNSVYEYNAQKGFKITPNDYSSDPFAQPKRTGVIGIKVGMTALWDKWGYRHVLTAIQLDRNQVVQTKTQEVDGYSALQIGAGEVNFKNITKPLLGHFLKHQIPPKKYLCEFKVTPENLLPVGYMLSVRHYIPGQLIDVKGVSVGKGFAGTIKRWNFNRQPASHGCSLSHRVLGSTGNRADPGRVFKGKKMPGRLGGEKKTVECLKIYRIDDDRQIIFVKGSIPGKAGSIVYIRDSIKKSDKNSELINYPTFVPQKGMELAKLITMAAPDEDPESREVHDNDVIKGDEEE